MELNTQKTEQKVLKKINQKSYFSAFLPNHKSQILHSTQKGFTLVETLVAIAVLLVAVVGPISLIGDAVHKLYYSRDEMIAINLAQEGIEAVRQMRDSNMLAGAAWDSNLAVNDYLVDVGRIMIGQRPITIYGPAGVGVPQPVYLSAGLYRQGAFTTQTQFRRILTITSINTDERKVAVWVTWQTGGQLGTIIVSENIFKWLP